MCDKYRERLNFFGLTVFVAFFVVQLTSSWEWSILIDDVGYNQWMPKLVTEKGFWGAWGQEIQTYIAAGRFYPLKYAANLVKWGYFPLNTKVFFWFDFCLVTSAIFMGSLAVAGRRNSLVFFIFGIGLLQRQVMEIAALNTVGEGWVILYFAAGLLCYPRPILYRLFFVLAALSKEPAIFVFLATTIVYTYQFIQGRRARTSWLLNSLVDLALLSILVGVVVCAKYFWADPDNDYTSSFVYLSVSNVKMMIMGVARTGVTMIAFLAFFGLFYWQDRKSFKELFCDADLFILSLFFGLFFLVAAAPRGVSGYIIVPESFAFFISAAFLLNRMLQRINWTLLRQMLAAVFLFFLLFYSVARYSAFARGTNEPISAIHHLLATDSPRLILMNSNEGAAKARLLAADASAPVTFHYSFNAKDSVEQINKSTGDVVLLEFSYFEKYSPEYIAEIGAAVGGWKYEFKRDYYRYFYGVKK